MTAGKSTEKKKRKAPAGEEPDAARPGHPAPSEPDVSPVPAQEPENGDEDQDEEHEDPEIGEECNLLCPYCGAVVLTDWENSFEVPSTSFCEHLVALHSWGCGIYEEPWIDESRRALLDELLLHAVEKRVEPRFRLSEWFDETMFSEGRAWRRKVRDWEIATTSVYVEAGLGTQGGGPTYIGVFLKSVPRKAARPSTGAWAKKNASPARNR